MHLSARAATGWLALVLLTSGYSDPIDPIVESGVQALDYAYIVKVKPDNAAFTKCAYMSMITRSRAGVIT